MKFKLCIFAILASQFICCSHLKNSSVKSVENTIVLKNEAEALNYLFEKRLQIMRLYELSSEPYFGKPEEKLCQDNIDIAGKIIKIPGGQYFKMRVLVNENFAIGDCLKENNTFNAIYLFVQCREKITEGKQYYRYEEDDPSRSNPKCN